MQVRKCHATLGVKLGYLEYAGSVRYSALRLKRIAKGCIVRDVHCKVGSDSWERGIADEVWSWRPARDTIYLGTKLRVLSFAG